ncbi:MAG: complex I NDUFA9 subunit family protein [candidate division KSB1 bacterium]|nr:complex I NDUFA9 subunit family protein [candidate division KSB1 bacterium]MDZ7346764.1 complex I NDUFA9 subunit family protein [candidate division KSB1 bacterium]
MNVFVTGATGFVGTVIIERLHAAGYLVHALVRNAAKAQFLRQRGVEVKFGDATDKGSLYAALTDCEAVVHLIAVIKEMPRRGVTFERINYEATLNLIEASKARGVRRFLHMSALGSSPDGPTPYFRTKGKAEEAVRHSGLEFTIFRPSFIYGRGDAVYSLLARMLRLSPLGLFPLFGDGLYRSQPVAVENVADGFVKALSLPVSIGKTYDVGGPDSLAFREQVELIGKAIGKSVRFLSLPLPLSRNFVRIAQLFPFSPIDLDRLTMLTSDNVCDSRPFAEELGIDLMPFEVGITYLKDV